MTMVAARELRNRTAEILRQVAGGTRVTVTVHGRPVAEIRRLTEGRPHLISKGALVELLRHRADPGLRDDLASYEELTGEQVEAP